jgi:hypothetical protein
MEVNTLGNQIKPEYIYDGIDGGLKYLFNLFIDLFLHVPDFREVIIATFLNIILNIFLKSKGLSGKQIAFIFLCLNS